MFKYLVEYTGRTIRICNNDKSRIISSAIKEFKSKCPINIKETDAIISIFDEDFKAFYEINPEDLPDMGKLQLSFKKPAITYIK